MAKEIYLDNAATTRVDDSVVKLMKKYALIEYGNASSQHIKGQEAKRALEQARDVIANSIGAKSNEIYFTSGGTESNNWALKGLWFENKEKGMEKNHIIVSKIEHDCVLNSCKWLEKQGAKVTYLDVDPQGFIDLSQLKKEITDKTLVVSVIHGNNEIGTIQELEEISKICKSKGAFLHTDACQSYTKVGINVNKLGLDIVTLNAHKIHGPKGVGALYIRDGIKIVPWSHGGGHEKGLRSGTENISGITGFAKAVKNSRLRYIKKMAKLRDYTITQILKIPKTKLNGAKGNKRLCNNVNICFQNIEGEAIGGYLEAYGICTSTGSACSSNTLESSHVLKSIGLNDLQSNTSIRISISKYTTKKEIDYFLKILPKIVMKLRKISPFK
jgi:cysteine desulfurase